MFCFAWCFSMYMGHFSTVVEADNDSVRFKFFVRDSFFIRNVSRTTDMRSLSQKHTLFMTLRSLENFSSVAHDALAQVLRPTYGQGHGKRQRPGNHRPPESKMPTCLTTKDSSAFRSLNGIKLLHWNFLFPSPTLRTPRPLRDSSRQI